MFLKKIFQGNTRENRIHERVDFFQNSYCMIEDHPDAYPCFLKDISSGGLAFDLGLKEVAEVPQAATVNIMYRIGSKIRRDSLNVKYSRKFIDNWHVGCQFTSDDDTRNELIADYFFTSG